MSNLIRRDVIIPHTIRDYNESWYKAFNRLNPGCPNSVRSMVLKDLNMRAFNVVRSYMMKQAVEDPDPNVMEVRAPVSAYERAIAESAEAIAEAKKAAAAIEEQEGERLQVPLEKATSTTSNKKVSFKTNLTNSGGTKKNKKRYRRHKKKRGKKTHRHRSKHYKR
jgi:hypothetical protein